MSDQVKFIKCTQDKYDKLTNVDNNALYFTTGLSTHLCGGILSGI